MTARICDYLLQLASAVPPSPPQAKDNFVPEECFSLIMDESDEDIVSESAIDEKNIPWSCETRSRSSSGSSDECNNSSGSSIIDVITNLSDVDECNPGASSQSSRSSSDDEELWKPREFIPTPSDSLLFDFALGRPYHGLEKAIGGLSGRSSTVSSPPSSHEDEDDSSGTDGYEDAVSDWDEEFIDPSGICAPNCKCVTFTADRKMDDTIVAVAAAEPEEVAVPSTVEDEIIPEDPPMDEEEQEVLFKTVEERNAFEDELIRVIIRDYNPIKLPPVKSGFQLPSKLPVARKVPFDSVFKKLFPPAPEPVMADFIPKDFSTVTATVSSNSFNPRAPEFVPNYASKRRATHKPNKIHINTRVPPPNFHPSALWKPQHKVFPPMPPCEFFPGQGGYLAFMPYVTPFY